jgi:uncharacterized iron-regulated protein
LIGIAIVNTFVPASKSEGENVFRHTRLRRMTPFSILFFCCATFLLAGCAGTRLMPPPAVATIPGVSEVFRRGQIVDLSSGKELSFDRLADHASSQDVVFVGEIHNNPADHLIELQILQGLFARNRSLTLAMEFFHQNQQAILDRYTTGDMTEEEFLDKVNWKKTWGFPYFYYRPLLLMAKQHRLKVLAVNAPAEIVGKVARGGLGALDADQRAQLPRDIDLSNEAERAFVRDAYGEHEHGELKNFQYFYEAQCVWEEAMARNIADYMKDRNQKVIVFSGNGHIIWKFGIPDRVRRRLPVSLVTIMPFSLYKSAAFERGIADFVWLTGP